MQGYVGEKVDISPRVHTMFENRDGIDFLAFVPRGGFGMSLPLAQHSETKQALRAGSTSEVLSVPTASVPSPVVRSTRLRHVP